MHFLTIILSLLEAPESAFFRAIRLLTFAKSLQYSEKMLDWDKLMVSNFRREQYRDLLSILAINLFLAHVLAVALNAMALLSPEHNWLTEKGIGGSPWYERYIWGYYWGTTVMLTVGFGDLAATNTQEAFCLTFIELLSCMALSYNINCLGNILSNLRMRNLERQSNLKTFNSMAKISEISEELENRVNNFIEGSTLIREEFNFHEQDRLLESIPRELRTEYLREANLRIFNHLQILRDFTMKSKKLIAEAIVKKVAHPLELLVKRDDNLRLLILKKGEVAFCIRNHNQRSSSVVLNTLRVDSKEAPRLVSIGFVRPRASLHDIRSQSYSILYELEKEAIIAILKQSRLDYEHYCVLRDRSEHMLGEDEPHACKECSHEYHLKLSCPKLHYIPLREHVINKYLYGSYRAQRARSAFLRIRTKIMSLREREMTHLEMCEFRQHNPFITKVRVESILPYKCRRGVQGYNQH